MASPTAPAYTEALALYDRLVAGHPDVERKGKTMPYTSVNGHMFSILAKNGVLGLRLPREARDAFLEEYDTKLLESHGTVMKEYVAVPSALLAKTEELQPFLAISYAYVSALKPKPTTRKAKAGGGARAGGGAKMKGTGGRKASRRKATAKKATRKTKP